MIKTNFILYGMSLHQCLCFLIGVASINSVLYIYITLCLSFLFVSATGKVLASELPDNVGKTSSVLYPASLKASNEIGVCFDFLIPLSLLRYIHIEFKYSGLYNKNRID